MHPTRDHWLQSELLACAGTSCPPEWMDSEDPLYILLHLWDDRQAEGLVHTTGGYSVQTYLTTKYIFDLRDDDVYFCTADIGWVTGHSYVVYGPAPERRDRPDVRGRAQLARVRPPLEDRPTSTR